MLVRTHFANDDTGNEPAHTTGGKDLEAAIPAFVDALAKHRHWVRESDPPAV